MKSFVTVDSRIVFAATRRSPANGAAAVEAVTTQNSISSSVAEITAFSLGSLAASYAGGLSAAAHNLSSVAPATHAGSLAATGGC